ncbi:MAG: enoyl-CoA hydratase/isomerase family protein [Bdellovibrionaceae bacterium]|nr:enoyl-CoA hydratase/isomerase family protein [Bdellovibrionales bacterium]MCB9084169.1 enoyl-CoA hydratase/isomerase family protein [Pseudobdellovibrionaceae bacterium]
MFSLEVNNKKIAILTMELKDQPVNVWNKDSVESFKKVVSQLTSDSQIKGAIFVSPRKDFLAGADLKALVPLSDVKRNMPLVRDLNLAFRQLEKWPRPVVAAIGGSALGGGYELCLACNHRVALNNDKIRIGLPEVQLGLIPGAGGTQRLPRMIGIIKAMSLLAEGKTMVPKKALEAGLVDALADTPEQLLQMAEAFIEKNPEILQPWGDKKFKIPGGGVLTPAVYMTFTAGNAHLRKKTYGNYPAVEAVMSAVYEGLQLPIDPALKVEERYFEFCLRTPEAANTVRTLFLGINALNGGMERPKGAEPHKTQCMGVLGGGMMGAGIAYAAAMAGIKVYIKDVNMAAAEKGKAYTQKVLQKRVERGQMTEADVQKVLAFIHPVDQYELFAECEMVVEAVIEDRKIKEEVIGAVDRVLPKDAFIFSNTSTLPITSLAEYCGRPERFAGLHFFSPVDKMPLVEIIRGEKSSDEAIARCFDISRQFKKTPIIVNDGRAFYTSRVFKSYVNQGCCLLKEGVSPALIENAGRMAGMPVGPLAVADEVSLDLVYHISQATIKDTGADFAPEATSIAELLVTQLKRLGRKSGGGFYDYPKDGKKSLWPGLTEHFKPLAEQPSVEEVKTRLLLAQAVEAARVWDRGVISSATAGDVGSILGWGFAPYTGGIFSYIDAMGVSQFVAECDRLAKQYGDTFKLPDSIRSRKSFHEAPLV